MQIKRLLQTLCEALQGGEDGGINGKISTTSEKSIAYSCTNELVIVLIG